MGETKLPKGPVAFLPAAVFPRLIAQSSVFTIHPPPEPTQRLVDICSGGKAVLGRYLIPAEVKRELADELAAIGVSAHTLFRDLDSLSKSIIENHIRFTLRARLFHVWMNNDQSAKPYCSIPRM